MIIVGLTGSIGMGKSTTAQMFAEAGVPVHDADASVHKLYSDPSVIQNIETIFPNSTNADGVDRAKLGQMVLGDGAAIKKLEALVHPLVHDAEKAFLETHKEAPLVLLDIPLLFETGADSRVDKIVVVTAPADVQKQRVLARDGMTEDRFDNILARQMPDAEKRQKADFIVDTSKGMDHARAQVATIIETLRKNI